MYEESLQRHHGFQSVQSNYPALQSFLHPSQQSYHTEVNVPSHELPGYGPEQEQFVGTYYIYIHRCIPYPHKRLPTLYYRFSVCIGSKFTWIAHQFHMIASDTQEYTCWVWVCCNSGKHSRVVVPQPQLQWGLGHETFIKLLPICNQKLYKLPLHALIFSVGSWQHKTM